MGKIKHITPGSIAEQAGLQPGMILRAVNRQQVQDIIQWKKALASPVLNLTLQKEDGSTFSTRVKHRSGDEIGIEFVSPTVDGLKQCQNNCMFCFVRQMPHGQRQTLYVKDDDYRLSLVYGSFVTLTNLSEEEWQRILREKISPIYVSVHTTNPELRVRMMGNKAAKLIMKQLEELVEAGITVHAQLVLVPGVNDGPELIKTLSDLSSLYPGVDSVAVVPVGLTGYRQGQPLLDGYSVSSARDVLDIVLPLSRSFRRRSKNTFIYVADEFFVLAQSEFPPASYYDEFSQLENGVGLCRLFVDEFLDELRMKRRRQQYSRPVLWITGESSSRMLTTLQHSLNLRLATRVDTVVVKNALFGGRVTVSGLLGGQDILRTLQSRVVEWEPDTVVLIPDITLRERQFLDDISMDDLQTCLPTLKLLPCPTNGRDLVQKTLYYGGEL